MDRKLDEDGTEKFQKLAFSILVEKDEELSSLRFKYASESESDRRLAADWAYHAEIAGELFSNALARAGQSESGLGGSNWPSGIAALAIDPLYSPALLTVGSQEYLVERIDEAMNLFVTLTKLPEEEDDLSEIIDKAGDFLIDNDDYENALALYSAAETAYPNVALYFIGSGYCLEKLGRYEDSVEKHRQADLLEPNNYEHLNDLGYSLLEAERFDESERVLKRSISLAPDDYEFSRNNLEELKKRRQAKKSLTCQ